MPNAFLEDGAARRHHSRELEDEVDNHRDAQGDPAEAGGKAVHNGQRRDDGPGTVSYTHLTLPTTPYV